MNRNELTLIITLAFVLTFILGWTLRWAYGRMNRVNSVDVAQVDDLATRLHDAEEARDQALTYMQQREYELTNQLSQSEAELNAAMEGLGDARREAEAYRVKLESQSSP